MVMLAVEIRRLFRALLAVAHIEQVRADDISAARELLDSFAPVHLHAWLTFRDRPVNGLAELLVSDRVAKLAEGHMQRFVKAFFICRMSGVPSAYEEPR